MCIWVPDSTYLGTQLYRRNRGVGSADSAASTAEMTCTIHASPNWEQERHISIEDGLLLLRLLLLLLLLPFIPVKHIYTNVFMYMYVCDRYPIFHLLRTQPAQTIDFVRIKCICIRVCWFSCVTTTSNSFLNFLSTKTTTMTTKKNWLTQRKIIEN